MKLEISVKKEIKILGSLPQIRKTIFVVVDPGCLTIALYNVHRYRHTIEISNTKIYILILCPVTRSPNKTMIANNGVFFSGIQNTQFLCPRMLQV